MADRYEGYFRRELLIYSAVFSSKDLRAKVREVSMCADCVYTESCVLSSTVGQYPVL